EHRGAQFLRQAREYLFEKGNAAGRGPDDDAIMSHGLPRSEAYRSVCRSPRQFCNFVNASRTSFIPDRTVAADSAVRPVAGHAGALQRSRSWLLARRGESLVYAPAP